MGLPTTLLSLNKQRFNASDKKYSSLEDLGNTFFFSNLLEQEHIVLLAHAVHLHVELQ